jgi:hypothetical protein
MKAFALFVLIAGTAFAVDSRIADVTVYADRAQITRTAEAALNAGENRVAITGLPDLLQDDSVRATGKASVPVTILDVQVKRDVHEKLSDDVTAKLEDETRKITGARRDLDRKAQAVQAEFNKRRASASRADAGVEQVDRELLGTEADSSIGSGVRIPRGE